MPTARIWIVPVNSSDTHWWPGGGHDGKKDRKSPLETLFLSHHALSAPHMISTTSSPKIIPFSRSLASKTLQAYGKDFHLIKANMMGTRCIDQILVVASSTASAHCLRGLGGSPRSNNCPTNQGPSHPTDTQLHANPNPETLKSEIILAS